MKTKDINTQKTLKVEMKWVNFLILGLFILAFAPIGSSLDTLQTVKQNDCINITQVCASCSYVNISSISNRENDTLVSNVGMVYFGNAEWRYEFCDTNYLGRYDVKGQGDIDGVDKGLATLFYVNPTGQEPLETSNAIILIIAIVVMFLVSALLISLTFKINNGVVITMLYGIAIIILFMTTLFSMTLIDNLLGNYTNVVSGYAAFVMVFKIILSMTVLGLTLYAGLRALKMYKIKRGLIDDE